MPVRAIFIACRSANLDSTMASFLAAIILMAALGLVPTFFAPETRGRDLNLPEDAI